MAEDRTLRSISRDSLLLGNWGAVAFGGAERARGIVGRVRGGRLSAVLVLADGAAESTGRAIAAAACAAGWYRTDCARCKLLQIISAFSRVHAGEWVVTENSGAEMKVYTELGKRAYAISEEARCGIVYITFDMRFHGEGGGRVSRGEERFQKNDKKRIFTKTADGRFQLSTGATFQPTRCAEGLTPPYPEVGSGKPKTGSPILTRREGASKAERLAKACARAYVKLPTVSAEEDQKR